GDVNVRQSTIPELPPALPSVGGIGRDDTFAKLALEGIAEVRVSEDSIRHPLTINTAQATKGTNQNGINGTLQPEGKTNGGLSPVPGSALTPNRSGSALTTPVKRKAIPAQLFEQAGLDPAQSPYASKESLTKHSNNSQPKLSKKESMSALSTKSGAGSVHGAKNEAVLPTPPVPPVPAVNGASQESPLAAEEPKVAITAAV
ncbi:hypothetical protein FRC17_002367, partial [Serendipita sp. 399]